MTEQPTKTSSRVILITGASAGLGYEMALAFARRGDRVAATARREDRLQQLTAAAQSLPGEILPIAADVTSAADMQRAVDSLMEKWGRLDVVIANAGIGQRGTVADSAWDDLEVVLRTNLDGVLHTVRAAIPALRKGGSGQIITISSVVALAPTPYAAIYAVSKAGVNALARAMRAELWQDNIWVTNVLLGQTHTEFAQVRRGQPGKVANKLPTMTAEYAASRIMQEVGRKHRTVTLRWLDHVINFVGVFFPPVMDRILERVYRIK